MALIAAHFNAGVILVVTVLRYVYKLPLPPPPYPLLPVPNKPNMFTYLGTGKSDGGTQ